MTADLTVLAYFIAFPSTYSALASAKVSVKLSGKVPDAIWRVMERFWGKYGEFPTEATFLTTLSQSGGNDQTRESLLEAAREIYQHPTKASDRELVLARILDNYRWDLQNTLEKATCSTIHECSSAIENAVRTLATVLTDPPEPWVRPLANKFKLNPLDILEEKLGPRCPTGLDTLDEWLGGGLYRGDSFMLIAITNHGKTLWANSILCDQTRAGKRSVFYSLEETQGRSLARIWANLTGIGLNTPKVSADYADRFRFVTRSLPEDRIILRNWPRDSASVEDIDRDLDRLRDVLVKEDRLAGVDPNEQGRIDNIFIDHIDGLGSGASLASSVNCCETESSDGC